MVGIIRPSSLPEIDLGNLAQLEILGGALSYAFAEVWGKVALNGQPALMNALGMLIGFTTLMFPIVIWIDGPPNLYIFVNSWVAVIGLAFLLIALAYILYFATLARAGAANLLLLTLLIPPFAIYLRQLPTGERLGPKALIRLRLLLLGLQSQTNA